MANYLDKKELYAALADYHYVCKEAKEKGEPKPEIPPYLCKAILLVSENLSYAPNFLNYTFKDEMIGDAIENCVRYIHNFNPEKFDETFSFAYLTQIAYHAFSRRIIKERKQTHIKSKIISQVGLDAFELQEQDAEGNFTNTFMEFIQANLTEDDYFERKRLERKEKRDKLKTGTLSEFIENE